jgi:Zn-dependent protease
MGSGGLTLFRVRGIRISVDFSWFVVLFLIIFWLSGFYRDVLDADQGDSAPYVLAVASAALFFGSILLHELGHAFVAMRNGIAVSSITLWMVAMRSAAPRSPSRTQRPLASPRWSSGSAASTCWF